MATRAEEKRKGQFKKQDFEIGRRRREETAIQLRKSKKEDQLMKRRQINAPSPSTTNNGDEEGNSNSKVYTVTEIPKLMSILINPSSPSEFEEAVRGFRRMLSVEVNPPVNEVIAGGAMPYLINALDQRNNNASVIFEAAWALTNIASTDRTKDVVAAGVVAPLILLLKNDLPTIREQAAWCLGNIAGDCPELRDIVLKAGALEGLILNVNEPANMPLLGNVTWAVSNLCRGKPSPDSSLIAPAIGPLAQLLVRQPMSKDVLVDAVWALSYLADGDDDRIQMVMDTGVTPELVALIANEHQPLLTPVIRTLGNFVTGTDKQTQVVVDAGILQAIGNSGILEVGNRGIRKETCWLLSNIGAGTEQQIDRLVKTEGIVDAVVAMAMDERWEIRREAIWTVANIFTTGSDYHLRGLVQQEGFCAIANALDVKDQKIVQVALEATEKILEVGDKLNLNYSHIFDEYGGIDKLEDLQHHPSEEIYAKSVEILEKFFGVEEDDDENIAPTQNGEMFGFGLAPTAKQLFADSNAAMTDSNGPTVFGMQSNNNYDFAM